MNFRPSAGRGDHANTNSIGGTPAAGLPLGPRVRPGTRAAASATTPNAKLPRSG
jgi:hypothetical protein